ncbi:putative F-box protein [Carex littledalei]|uniref:Putative F-box protein n=1 Tax=Carex littledalei TaxID=544730 RepID=A0A833RH78_9POAL|nr:putative F-box protein [Carex littledalei]
MAPPPSTKWQTDLPDHLLHQMILPRVPFKCLLRYKCVSKEIYSLISTDAVFAANQSRSANTSSSGFVYMTCSGLSFFPDPELIGVPDPSLNFLNLTSPKVDLVSSTNGLLLLYGEFNGMKSHCVCNPATKEMAVVPNNVNVVGEEYYHTEMGFAYDPCELPHRYTIVDPLLMYHSLNNVEFSNALHYQFNIFHSDTGKWTRSSQRVYLDIYPTLSKAVCAKGVLYWCCGQEYLLWYDTKRDLAGSLMWPEMKSSRDEMFHVGVNAGEITCCHTWIHGIEMWTLTGGSRWDRIHATSWDGLLDKYDFGIDLNLARCRQYKKFVKRYFISPIGYDGQFLYIAACQKDRYNKLSWLFSWETEPNEFQEKGLFNIEWDFLGGCFNSFFTYANSMAKVPQICVPKEIGFSRMRSLPLSVIF